MAVYTQLEPDAIAALIAPLGLGRLTAAQGVAAGVENTTYFLRFAAPVAGAPATEYVLTIAETLSRADLEFVATLTHALNARGLPVPAPACAGDHFASCNAVLSTHGKPAVVVPKISGAHPQQVTPDLCRQVGSILAKLHRATTTLGCQHESHRSLRWIEGTAKSLLAQADNDDRELLHQETTELSQFVSANTDLPQAIIHGDLFRDNVLIENGSITALIDFFSAGTGYLLLDLAIIVNDWCFDAQGNLNLRNYNALTAAYCAVRPPERLEIERWSSLLRIAALRFWVSRLNEQLSAGPHTPRGRGKNPAPYRRLLQLHRHSPLQLVP